jgi:DNA polymerase-3 subunit beta
VERKNTIPILANVLLQVEDGTLKLTATDMDIDLMDAIPVIDGQDGATTVPVHLLYDIVRKLPEDAAITLQGEGGNVVIKAGKSRFSLPTLPIEDFPALNQPSLATEFTLAIADVKKLIDRTRFAMSTEETRYFLNGIYLHVSQGETKSLRGVATDGHRLALTDLTLPEGADGFTGVIIPRKTINELRKLLDDAANSINIQLSDTRIRFIFDGIRLSSKLIDGTFPDYNKVIPSSNDKSILVDASNLACAVDRVATISTDKTRAVKLHITSGALTVSASSQDNSSATETIDAAYEGDEFEIGFNARYLLDIFGQIDGNEVDLQMLDSASPTIVSDSKDSSSLYVLMPMRV